MKVLAKISGDLADDEKILKQIIELSKSNEVTLIHGCGTQISNALNKGGINYTFKDSIRLTSQEGLEICLYECQLVRQELKKKLNGYNIKIISPVSRMNEKIINKNAEEIFREEYNNYERWIIYTKFNREKPLVNGLIDIEIIYMG